MRDMHCRVAGCLFVGHSPNGLKLHYRDKHPEIVPRNKRKRKQGVIPAEPGKVKGAGGQFHCKQCGAVADSPGAVQKHYREKHPELIKQWKKSGRQKEPSALERAGIKKPRRARKPKKVLVPEPEETNGLALQYCPCCGYHIKLANDAIQLAEKLDELGAELQGQHKAHRRRTK